ncbi:MAG: GxGYxYP family putative glycoside hydrolase [Ktedonobacteraceae bacterium]
MSFDVPGLDWSDERMIPAFQAIQHLDVYDFRDAARDEQVAATIIAGIVNRPQPRIYLLLGDDDALWLSQAFSPLPQTLAPQSGHSALFALLDTYHTFVKGLIIFNPALIDTLNVATTLAGQQDGIVVSPDLARVLQEKYALPVIEDLRKYQWSNRLQVYRWAQQHLLAGASSRFIAGLDPGAFCSLRSFLVATRTFVYWLDASQYMPELSNGGISERGLMQQLYQNFANGALHLGWFVNEPAGVALTSQAAIPVLASDYFTNLEVWSAFQQPITPTSSGGEGRADRADTSTPAKKIYVSFTMSDGDNLQYCQHRLLKLWRDEARGSAPIGWTLAPALVHAAPAMADYYMRTASENDEFIAGPDGAAYLFPSFWPREQLAPFLRRTGKLMQVLGMTTLEVLDSDVVYSSGLPVVSKVSLNGMAFTNGERQRDFVTALRDYGLRGIVSGAGFVLKRASWQNIDGLPLYQNLGIVGSIENAVTIVKLAATLSPQRPLFLNLYVLAWSMGPTQLRQVMQQLGSDYEFVLPGTLLAMLNK